LLALPSDSPSAVETLEAAEEHSAAIAQRQQMLRALQALDPIRRDLLIAAYLHGESRAELSKRAGVPVNTVKTWIRRAVLEIQKSMRNAEATNSPVPAGAERDRNPKPVTLPPARQLKTGARPAHPF
jgi:DNA-directed RNA polymerase specialized sigma24 family protein